MTRDLRKYARQTNVRIGVGAGLLLLIVGTGLIYYIYGPGAAVGGLLCLLAALVPIGLIFLSLAILDWIQKRANRDYPARISKSLNVASGIDTELIQFDNWTLRIRRTTHHAPRLLLLIHGWTGDENSMWVFARDLPAHYWMVAPRAPHITKPGGYSWRPNQSELIGNPTYDMFTAAAEGLIKLVDAYQRSACPEPSRRAGLAPSSIEGIDASVFDVIGFSQGAVMASMLAFLYPHRIRKTGILAGFIPGGLDELVTKRPLEGKPFFVTHGTKDETVTIDRARDSLEILERAGARVTYCEDEVGHKVSLPCLRALRDFLAD